MAPEEQASDPAARRRRWKRVRTSVTLLVLIGFVVGAAWYSWRNVIDQEDDAAAPVSGAACAPGAPTAAPDPAQIEVNVYNSTSRNGLASAVARQIRERGFIVLDIANDPLDKSIDVPAEVRSHTDQQAAAALVATLVQGAAYVPDERGDATVDLVLGEKFTKLAPPSASGKAPATDLPPCESP